jgi:hypothetical protein
MAFFHHHTEEQLMADGFVYRGRFAGLVPVYLGSLSTDTPDVTTCNWCPEWVLDLTICLFQMCAVLVQAMGGEVDGFPVYIQSRIDGVCLDDDPEFDDDDYDDDEY